jgi:hypothetical protein
VLPRQGIVDRTGSGCAIAPDLIAAEGMGGRSC